MHIGSLPGLRSLPLVVKHQLRASLFVTALVCWLVLKFSWLAERRPEQKIGTEMYVMF
jgi:hypothetical protein